jgi:type I restriction-modification system DNA methylase subunit
MKEALKQVSSLVERFERNIEAYRSPAYNETQLRREFVDPFFEALGWDVTNKAGYAEQYKDVIHEDSIKVAGATKAPDYCFRIGGARKFFLETKKPSVDIKDQINPAYQLRRYAWSSKLPLSILTDFEEMAIYDCRLRPKPNDKPSIGRIRLFTYNRYLDSFEEIYDLLSKESVLKGSFDKFVESEKQKRGTTEVDAEFLKEIESWREVLAKNIAIKNPRLSVRELNYAVQLTIDRIIFLRMCEDRGIEKYGQIQTLLNGANTYHRLREIFYKADDKYNSGLFDFRTDRLTPELKIDDNPLKEIFKNLYYPDSPYEFSVLGADILGHVYEQFLGKVIRLTEGHHAKIEEKPEVRKAGGVYYTPTYIVEYIVKNTVGKIVGAVLRDPPDEGTRRGVPLHRQLSPQQISKIRILDPACGSGSFLLGAYQFLLNYHRDWYIAHYTKRGNVAQGFSPAPKEIYRGYGGQWYLTTQEKKRILLNNIYGVDIDPQAVEVTKLSLLLTVLEGENQDTLERQMRLFKERALPDLGSNVKCGNSLIGPDFYSVGAGHDLPLFKEAEAYRINAFDWEKEFPEIMKRGGFDAVIGNPPYVRSITLKDSNPLLWEFCRTRYRSASTREWDIYLVFVEKGLSLLEGNGKLGYILPNKFLNSRVGENLRAILSEGKHLEKLVHFGALQIFQGATTYTCLLFLDREGKNQAEVARYVGPVNGSVTLCSLPEKAPDLWATSEVSAKKFKPAPWDFPAPGGVLEKLRRWSDLGSVAQVFQGAGTRADRVFLVEDRGRERGLIRIFSAENEKEYLLEPTFLKPALRGRNIGRYQVVGERLMLIVPYEVIDGKSVLVPQKKLADLAPNTLEYLRECKTRLDERENGRFKGEKWYCYGRPQNMDRFEVPEKIVLPDVTNRGTCFLDRDRRWLLDTAYGIVFKANALVDLRYILAILNSPLLTYFLKETGTILRGGYFRMKTAYLNPFPIRPINFPDPTEKACHDTIVKLVEQMLSLHKLLAITKTPDDKTRIQRQIDATDHQIDHLVYELYGLTDEEIKIVQ